MAGMMDAAVDGKLDFVGHTSEYGRRAGIVKKLFTDNGFHIVYSMDGENPISDGFFFTVGYPNLSGEELQRELLRYGVSSISLPSTGSDQEGIRVTVSMISSEEDMKRLGERLRAFDEWRKSTMAEQKAAREENSEKIVFA